MSTKADRRMVHVVTAIGEHVLRNQKRRDGRYRVAPEVQVVVTHDPAGNRIVRAWGTDHDAVEAAFAEAFGQEES